MTITNLQDSQNNEFSSYSTDDELTKFFTFNDIGLLNLFPTNRTERTDALIHLSWKGSAILDQHKFTGTKHLSNQELAFGRDNLKRNGVAVSNTSDYTPEDIFEAHLLICKELLTNPALGSISAHNNIPGNIDRFRAGTFEVDFTTSRTGSTGINTMIVQNNFISQLILPYTVEETASTTIRRGGSKTFGTGTESFFGNNRSDTSRW